MRWHLRPPFVALVGLSLLLTACGQVSIPGLRRAPEPVPLKVVVLPMLSYAPYLVAQEEGFFTEQGLNVELVQFQRSQDAIPALVQGQLDVLGGALSFGFLNAITRGGNIRMVSDKGIYTPGVCAGSGLVARKALVDSGGLKDVSQLKGKRIVLNPASSSGYLTDLLLHTAGLSLKDIIPIDLSDPALIDAFDKDQIDVAVTSEPTTSRLIHGGQAVMWRPADALSPGLSYAFISFGPNLLEKSPEVGERFMVAYLKGVRQYSQGKTERNLAILEKYTQLDRETLNRACWPAFQADGRIDARRLTEFQAWAKANNYLDQIVPEDKLLDSRFVEAAKRQK